MECRQCIHTEKTKKIINGLCKDCIIFNKFPPDFEKMKLEVENILYSLKGKKNKCILAFSGGKDSILSLKLLVEKFKIKPLCVMIDNNYLAKEAIENALNLSQYYNVDLLIIREDFTDLFNDCLAKRISPCKKCSKRILSRLWSTAKNMKMKYIITGHEIPFGHLAVRNMKEGIKMIRLLAPYRIKEEEKYNLIKNLPWKKPNLFGYTTNCLILGVAIKRFYEKYGFSFELDRVATLVRLNLLRKEKAKEYLKLPTLNDRYLNFLRKKGIKYF